MGNTSASTGRQLRGTAASRPTTPSSGDTAAAAQATAAGATAGSAQAASTATKPTTQPTVNSGVVSTLATGESRGSCENRAAA